LTTFYTNSANQSWFALLMIVRITGPHKTYIRLRFDFDTAACFNLLCGRMFCFGCHAKSRWLHSRLL